MKKPFICVEGPIGVGKTTISGKLAEEFGGYHLREIVEENPFLAKFYEDPKYALENEVFFMCNRYRQLTETAQRLANNVPVVADYHITKDILFGKLTLKGDELDKYLRIHDIMIEGAPSPDLVIYSNGSLDTLMSRIKKRGRDIEKDIDPEYIRQLSEDYKATYGNIKEFRPNVNLIEINADTVDFDAEPERYESLIQCVRSMLIAIQKNPHKQHYCKFN